MVETIIGPRRQPFLMPGMPPPGDEAHVMTVAVRRGESWVWIVRDGGDRWRVLEPSGEMLGVVIGYDEALAEATRTAEDFGEAAALQLEADDRRQRVRERLRPAPPQPPAEPSPDEPAAERDAAARPR